MTLFRIGVQIGQTRSGPDGSFRLDVSNQAVAAAATYQLHIPAAAVRSLPDGVDFLGPAWIPWVLVSAFSWAWIGFAVVVFRTGMRAVPRDLLRVVRAFGGGRRRQLALVIVPALLPVAGLVLLIVLVAATRVFDLVYVAAPGSMQEDVEVMGVHWWRWAGDLGQGAAAALAVLMFIVVASFVLVAVWGLSREWPGAAPVAAEPVAPRSRLRRWTVRTLGTAAMAIWLAPFLELLLTSLRSPRDAGVGGWWRIGRDGWGLGSYRQAFASGELPAALLSTASRAAAATVLLVLLAVPAGYALASSRLPRRLARIAVALTAVLAVVPVQAVAAPLAARFSQLPPALGPIELTAAHVALGLPMGVLLLRAAFATVPYRPVPVGQTRPFDRASALATVVARSWPAVLAVAVLEFVQVWNDFVVGLLLGGSGNPLITVVLATETRDFTTSSGFLAGTSVTIMIVPLVLILTLGRWIVRGIAFAPGRSDLGTR